MERFLVPVRRSDATDNFNVKQPEPRWVKRINHYALETSFGLLHGGTTTSPAI